MNDSAEFALSARWPSPGDPLGAARLRERFAEQSERAHALSARPDVAAMLDAIGGGSPYLSDLAVREHAALCDLIERGPDSVAEAAFARLAAIAPSEPRQMVAAGMRVAKRQIALATAIADIGGIWPLAAVTLTLTRLADATLGCAVGHLLLDGHTRGDLLLPDPDRPERGSGFIVLGMGKLGAGELNYSSDVDLILLYDPAASFTDRRGDGPSPFFSRIARDLVAMMDRRDSDGYVFRTDLRLRPDPGSTPPAMNVLAALTYYESMGENWERAAMSKARPVAGDRQAGYAFLAELRPFIWRRGLDFAAVADIVSMKRRIDTFKGTSLRPGENPVARVLGHDLKLGQGGIREIEFLAQTLELVWGGRDPSLRDPTTLGALAGLAATGHLDPHAAAELADAYGFLRSAEHRLQMVGDRQTHSLPATEAEFARFSAFMGRSDPVSCATEILGWLGRVQAHYRRVFEAVPEPPPGIADRDALDFRGNQSVPERTLAALRAFGFQDHERVVSTVRGWMAGQIRALRSERARLLIGQLTPAILAALAHQPHPDTALDKFDAFLSQLSAGVQLLSLFERNPHLLDRVATVLGAAPQLADHLTRHPAALDGLLIADQTPAPHERLETRLEVSRDLEESIAIVRRTVREDDFNISVATLDGRIGADEAGSRRSELADAAINALLPRVLADFRTRFGAVRGGRIAVIALGKAGSREMLAGSDLDLIFIYDHPEDVAESDGARRMPVGQWFVRATQAFVAALTAPGSDGPLYAIDMRLRPSGSAGPVAVSLDRFRYYHAHSSWTWERMALTRARVVAGTPGLIGELREAIAIAIQAAGPAETIREDARAMRTRMLRDLPANGPWDVKLRPGGLVEVEFVAQVLQLIHTRTRPDLRSTTTRTALANLRDADLLSGEDAALLIRADRVWRSVQGMIRLMTGKSAREPHLTDASAEVLLRTVRALGLPAVDADDLRAMLDAVAREVRAAFVRHIGDPET